jgi:hypothetical protein
MATNLMGELVANNGTFILNNTTEYTGSIDAIVVLEDTVFNAVKIAGVDVKSSYIATPATAVKAGAIITPTADQKFSGVDLTSGSVALVLG